MIIQVVVIQRFEIEQRLLAEMLIEEKAILADPLDRQKRCVVAQIIFWSEFLEGLFRVLFAANL